jgi:hypothetical protein
MMESDDDDQSVLQLINQIPWRKDPDPHATGDHLHDPDLMPALGTTKVHY